MSGNGGSSGDSRESSERLVPTAVVAPLSAADCGVVGFIDVTSPVSRVTKVCLALLASELSPDTLPEAIARPPAGRAIASRRVVDDLRSAVRLLDG